MNGLLSKLRDFGLIFRIDSTNPEEIKEAARGLRKAHIPVVLLEENNIRETNRSEDLFIGTFCPDSAAGIDRAFASGAHFAFIPGEDAEVMRESRDSGLDIFPILKDGRFPSAPGQSDCEAVLLPGGSAPAPIPYFLDCAADYIIPEEHLLNPLFIGAVFPLDPAGKSSDKIAGEALSRLRSVLGIQYLSLSLKKDSERREEGKVFAALSAVPLIEKGREDLLTVGVRDMDRTIAYLKWSEIYIDPFTARMKNGAISSARLYGTLAGWPIQLVRTGEIPAD